MEKKWKKKSLQKKHKKLEIDLIKKILKYLYYTICFVNFFLMVFLYIKKL